MTVGRDILIYPDSITNFTCSSFRVYFSSYQRAMLLERERSSQLYSRRHEFRKVFCALEEAEVKLNQQRKAESKSSIIVCTSTYMHRIIRYLYTPSYSQPRGMVIQLDAVRGLIY